MNGAQIAHLLKQIGHGSELEGVLALYNKGRLVGAGQALLAGIAVCGTYCLGRWGYGKLINFLQENGYISLPSES